MTANRLAIAVHDASTCASVPSRATIRRWIKAALGAGHNGELAVRVVDEEESAQFNLRYRKRAGATNVLSFPAGDTPALPDTPTPIGDLVICAAIVESEAISQGKTAESHWAHIVVHGTLHLLGYDHETDAQAQVMEAKERELLAQFGFPDPYVA